MATRHPTRVINLRLRLDAWKLPFEYGRSWPGRAEAALKFIAGMLTFAGTPRPRFQVRLEGRLMAGTADREWRLWAIHISDDCFRLLRSPAWWARLDPLLAFTPAR
jgi:hypothetical protein